MLTKTEIKYFIERDNQSALKRAAREGRNYYEGKHDILDYRLFYYNSDGDLVEDTSRSNFKIPHPFFTELVDQGVQYVLSGHDSIVRSDDTKLQAELDKYFYTRKFNVELSEALTGMQAEGFSYMYAYTNKDGRLAFQNADCLGVVEVEGRFAEDGQDQRIYKYLDIVDKDGKEQWKILVIDRENTYFYRQTDNGDIEEDDTVTINPKPHRLYDRGGKLYTKDNGFLPFFRLDNNKKRQSNLKAVKALIDDYDIMASSLTNNLVDFDTPLHVIRGFQGDNLDELQQNLKTKKIIGVDGDGGVEVHTVDIPYQARVTKLELDERNIYKFGLGLNTAGLKDTNATTNIAIKAAYSLLELRCNKIIAQLELFLEELVEHVLDEINERQKSDYQMNEVYFVIEPSIMSNATENAGIELTEAQKAQVVIGTLLNLQNILDNETIVQLICEQLDIDYEQIKSKLPNPDDAQMQINEGNQILGA